jgi:alkaline phosphatase D
MTRAVQPRPKPPTEPLATQLADGAVSRALAGPLSRRTFLRGAGVAGLGALAPACGSSSGPQGPAASEPERVFLHGVASGDPLSDRVILWTRVTPEGANPPEGELTVGWQVATDLAFAQVVASGEVTTSVARDLTVKVDAAGLSPSTTYYYRFSLGDVRSPIGRTRTLPEGDASRLRIALLSCQSRGHGYYAVHRHLAGRADLDLVLFLGDYIYEYGDGEYGIERSCEPAHECVSLADYRARHAQYKRDPDLRACHQQHPFIATWDDHETADNSWNGGANNHQPDEGPWAERRSAGYQAYVEWMPIREQEELKLWRRFSLGGLVDLFVLDTRIWGREAPIEDPDDPAIADPARTMLGQDQETWLFEGLSSSTATWKLLGQQVMMMQLPEAFAPFAGGDAWDGYPACRARLFDAITAGGVTDVLVCTGDIHMSFVADLAPDLSTYDPSDGAGSIAVEIVTPAVSSPGAPLDLAFDEPHVRWSQTSRRGFALLDVTPQKTQVSYYHLAITPDGLSVEDPDNLTLELVKMFDVHAGTSHAADATTQDAAPSSQAALASPAIERPADFPVGFD